MNSARSLAAICIASIMVPVLPYLLIGELPGEAWLRASSEHSLVFGKYCASKECSIPAATDSNSINWDRV